MTVIPAFLLPSFPRRQESIRRDSAIDGGESRPVSLNPQAPRHSRESRNLLEANLAPLAPAPSQPRLGRGEFVADFAQALDYGVEHSLALNAFAQVDGQDVFSLH